MGVIFEESMLSKKTFILDPKDNYMTWLILKFITIAKEAILSPDRLSKIIIGDGMIFEEKKLTY